MTIKPCNAGRAVVGVTANRQFHDGVHRDWLRRRYIEALDRYAYVECVILPTFDSDRHRDVIVNKLREVMRRLDGLVLTGDESDLDPYIFNEQIRVWDCASDDVISGKRDRPRDRLSSVALSIAIELDMPILGICRGLQEMNVHRGGMLNPNLPVTEQGIVHSEIPNVSRDQQYLPVHTIQVVPGGLLSSIIGEGKLCVNSLHNQGITEVASGVQMEAVAEDGVIEALSYSTSRGFQLGIQWHPEWHVATDPTSQKIFTAFGNACQVYQSTGPLSG
ncbi:gamma-glutamyl-gamma-aminobutyrate hydrolase family protein [Candidatus Erwinia dacicola]|uniref:gamma-glutamyl-gamma-aminobutyrate hydrolase n=1 Tax=Candidatus Erwinia dacicola TaxID=252393 RepID=A0A1E7YUT2_9GAMM|nr:gamma-glutamyl-gamma-aminobutyrate hydrolase family protein [Candidatus Erwinia dacicola]NJD00889.1 gamma-glutamyl-gamma-aminobutyrate hydrolase family protein [Candidatus Erwinia dacicola]NJD85924.1 gamma-glutamyl-gamma-aminobutyrate hydrolase family protein [Candidatus Erwinia dacicola]OFC58689.1 gamma-glutamyl-gamma-aminobutyrate hydrolase [Candidatus Erwinia dacicola]RAP72078.1 glutamine amidotransferase class-I family protein [Candidatus Erwinia dacicola]